MCLTDGYFKTLIATGPDSGNGRGVLTYLPAGPLRLLMITPDEMTEGMDFVVVVRKLHLWFIIVNHSGVLSLGSVKHLASCANGMICIQFHLANILVS